MSTEHSGTSSTDHYQPSRRWVVGILVAAALVGAYALRVSPSLQAGGKAIRQATTTTLPGGLTSTTQPRSQIQVQVANGTNVAGLARSFTQQLMTQGWDTLPGINGPKVPRTVIYYHQQYVDAAVAIQKYLGKGSLELLAGAKPVPLATSIGIIILIGPDLAG